MNNLISKIRTKCASKLDQLFFSVTPVTRYHEPSVVGTAFFYNTRSDVYCVMNSKTIDTLKSEGAEQASIIIHDNDGALFYADFNFNQLIVDRASKLVAFSIYPGESMLFCFFTDSTVSTARRSSLSIHSLMSIFSFPNINNGLPIHSPVYFATHPIISDGMLNIELSEEAMGAPLVSIENAGTQREIVTLIGICDRSVESKNLSSYIGASILYDISDWKSYIELEPQLPALAVRSEQESEPHEPKQEPPEMEEISYDLLDLESLEQEQSQEILEQEQSQAMLEQEQSQAMLEQEQSQAMLEQEQSNAGSLI